MANSILKTHAIYPQALGPGDIIAIISPAAPSQSDAMDKGVALIEAAGFKAKVMPNALKSRYYLAGTDDERLSDLHQAFEDTDVKGIISARGGYGCMRLLPRINWDVIKTNPKVLVGFSDLTSLLNPIYQETGLVSFHGPMLTSNLLEKNDYTNGELWKQITGQATYPYVIPNQSNYQCFKEGVAEGSLMGGNLSLLAAMCGSKWQPNTQGAVLFIEDWHEKFYTLDRKIQQLHLAGMFDGIAGLLLGDFVEIEPEENYALIDLFKELTQSLQVPMGFGFSLGHGETLATFPLGCPSRFEASSGRLEILSAPVRQGSQ